ncbi:Dehydrodolichyl diphosphate synthase 6, partial [Cucurbita argyrosperma subsp. sororia]
MRIGNVWMSFWVTLTRILEHAINLIKRSTLKILSMGPIPNHVAFILDGNRRFAKKQKLVKGFGYKFGYIALMFMLKYCYELGVTYVTIYVFSIDNFKRSPQEVDAVMDLILEKVELWIKGEGSVYEYGIRLHFLGDLNLLSEPVREAVERAIAATKNNNGAVLAICVAYTSTDEIVHAVERACEEKWDEIMNSKRVAVDEHGELKLITLSDVEKHMYAAVTPDPELLIRTSGEARLSNFLLWQTSCCYLYSTSVLWPEVNVCNFMWAILNFQRNHFYLVRKRKELKVVRE